MSSAKAKERLLRQLEGVESLEGCLELFEELKAAQDDDPDDHGLWELRLRVMRRLGKLLPPKHTGHGGAATRGRLAVDRRLAYKARLIAGVPKRSFERILREWRKQGERPKVQLLIRTARKERGEDPRVVLRKLETVLEDFESALPEAPKNEKAIATIRRALARVDLGE